MNKRTVSLKLLSTPEQSASLADLAATFAHACAAMVPLVQEHRCWNRVALHHLAYYPVREQFPALGSQMVCQAIHRVADAYKTLKENKGLPKDKPVPAVAFDASSVNFDKRTYSIRASTLSLFTLSGRIKVAFTGGRHQRNLLAGGAPKEARLVIRKGIWYFHLVLGLPEVSPVSGGGVLGVDVGENNLASSSTGRVWGGDQL